MRRFDLPRLLIAAIPLASVLLLLLLFVIPVKKYVQCQSPCQDISDEANLKRVLVVPDPTAGEVLENDPEIKRKKAISNQERTGLVYSGRLTFLFFAVTYAAVSAIALAIGCFVIAKSFASESKHPIWWMILVAGICGAAGSYLYNHPELYMRIFDPLLKITISADLAAARTLMMIANSFGFAVALLLTLASCAVLYSRHTGSYPDGLRQIAAQTKHLRLVLYVGTVMLVTGVLLMRSVYQWVLAFLWRDAQVVKVADRFLSELLSIEGAYFTFILAAVYLPAAFILQRRADSLAELPELETEKEQVLKDYGLGVSLTQSLPRVLAILGPLLAGPVGELFSRVG